MRTTVSISDHLLAEAKEQARRRGKTLSELVEDSLRVELSSNVRPPRRPIPVFTAGTGPRPGIDLASNRSISEVLDERTSIEQLR